jgi:putative nucleotidyltransferase with HDIG domain
MNTLVPTGSFSIGKKSNSTLVALLGSCIGVTLVDKEAGVGGLLHLLLPEPPGQGIPRTPEKYATTGIPVFIKALCDKGARPDSLVAAMAGGALLEPYSQLDFLLDIGGRTAEISERMLKDAGIRIVRRETGGVMGCKLSLDMMSFESLIEPILSQAGDSASVTFRTLDASSFDRAVESVKPIPQVALKILRMINDLEYDVDDIAHEVAKDQVLGAKVLRLCNSVFFGLKKKVDSIGHAIMLLGDKRFVRLAVSAGVEELFPESGGYSLSKGGLYFHALRMALLCESLGPYFDETSGGLSYTAGLLHDIGKVVLDQYMAPVFPLFYRKMSDDQLELVKVEKEAFGMDHCEAGLRLARRWGLPPNLSDAIAFHHRPEEAGEAKQLANLVYLGELILSKVLPGQDLEGLDSREVGRRLGGMGVDRSGLVGMIDGLPRQIFSSGSSEEFL